MNKKYVKISLIIIIILVIIGVLLIINKKGGIKLSDKNQLNKILPAGGMGGRGDENGIQSPDGKRSIKIETHKIEGLEEQSVYYITIDGENTRSFNFIGNAVFSPDSRQYAYSAGENKKQFVVLNGKNLKQYDYVYTPSFSPDSSRFIYVASIGKTYPDWKQFVVIDGTEEKPYEKIELIFTDYGRGFSPDSKHIIYSALKDKKWFVVIDNKEGKKYDRISMLTISEDGKKITYESKIDNTTEIITETLD